MRWVWLAVFTLQWANAASVPEPAKAPLHYSQPLRDKNFYLLAAMADNEAVRSAIAGDPDLKQMAIAKLEKMHEASTKCGGETSCYAAAFVWSSEEIEAVDKTLRRLYRTSSAVRGLADGQLRTSGMYARSNSRDGADLLTKAWDECAAGVNHVIDVYALGKPGRYPDIDGPRYDVKAERYGSYVLKNLTGVLEDGSANLQMFFQPSLQFALELLVLQGRDEAARFEPLAEGANAAAAALAQKVDWSRYVYSAILVPGAGNDRPGVRISPAALLRDELAARRYRSGAAPFVIVSGGFVHPNQTEFAEANEMRTDLHDRLGVPLEAILMEPHARHTTTNLRNAARLLYRYGMPFSKKMLVTTDASQSAYIEGKVFAERCMKELEYLPFQLLGRVNAFDLEVLPAIESLQADPRDPLDP